MGALRPFSIRTSTSCAGSVRAQFPTGWFVLVGLLIALSGCQGISRVGGPGNLTQSDRLMAYYGDLHTGRFAVIADFEHTKHMELFRSVSASGTSLHRLSLTSGIAATGSRCLRAEFAEPEDELTADGSVAGNWNLPRDWRDYDLLIMAVHAPVAVNLQLSLVSGRGKHRSIADSRIPLDIGWNLLRLDLADAADHIALDDIRELRWSLPAITHHTVLLIDDIILSANQADLFGDSSAEDGKLYLRRHGRRWDIGAAGRFELGLINGQIKYWYDLTNDRLRVRNLVDGCVMGPSVVILTGDEDFGEAAVESFPAWGDRIIARQRLMEASNTRIVVSCVWDFVSAEGMTETDTPWQKWTYTIYPSGAMYVHLECATETPTWTADRLGLTVSLQDREHMKILCHSTSQLGDTGRLLHVPYAYAGTEGSDGSGLLFVVHDGRSAPLMRCLRRNPISRMTAVAFGGETQKPVQQWDCLFDLGPAASEAERAAAARAVHYCFPPTLSPTVGELVTDSTGDRDHDGFNERFGCYVLAPDANRVLLTFDGKDAPLYDPVFAIRAGEGLEAWVYLDYVILENVSRTARGDVLFQVPGTLNSARTLEVYLRRETKQRRR